MTYRLRMGMRRRAVIRYGWDIIAWDRGFPWRSSPRPHRKPSDMAVSRELLEVCDRHHIAASKGSNELCLAVI